MVSLMWCDDRADVRLASPGNRLAAVVACMCQSADCVGFAECDSQMVSEAYKGEET